MQVRAGESGRKKTARLPRLPEGALRARPLRFSDSSLLPAVPEWGAGGRWRGRGNVPLSSQEPPPGRGGPHSWGDCPVGGEPFQALGQEQGSPRGKGGKRRLGPWAAPHAPGFHARCPPCASPDGVIGSAFPCLPAQPRSLPSACLYSFPRAG